MELKKEMSLDEWKKLSGHNNLSDYFLLNKLSHEELIERYNYRIQLVTTTFSYILIIIEILIIILMIIW